MRGLGVLGGAPLPLGWLSAWAAESEWIIAADHGLDHLVSEALRPDVWVGDGDSVQASPERHSTTVLHQADQHTSDVQKLLAVSADLRLRRMVLACVEGDRVDHLLGTLFACAASGQEIALRLRRQMALILRSGDEAHLEAAAGTTLSVFPLGESAEVTLTGVAWPLERATLSPQGLWSLSNATLGGPVSCRVGRAPAVLFWGHDEPQVPLWSVSIPLTT